MKVYIPTKNIVSDNILKSISEQTVQSDIEIVICNYPENIPKMECIARAKEDCRKKAILLPDKFIIIHESDCLDLYTDNFEIMFNFLTVNKDYGAVSLFKDDNPALTNAVTMYKKEALEKINFSELLPQCTCMSMIKSLKKNNFDYTFADKKIRIKHIRSN